MSICFAKTIDSNIKRGNYSLLAISRKENTSSSGEVAEETKDEDDEAVLLLLVFLSLRDMICT